VPGLSAGCEPPGGIHDVKALQGEDEGEDGRGVGRSQGEEDNEWRRGRLFILVSGVRKAHVHPSSAKAPHIAPFLVMNDIWL